MTTFIISEQDASSENSVLFNENDNKYDEDSSSVENERLISIKNRQKQN